MKIVIIDQKEDLYDYVCSKIIKEITNFRPTKDKLMNIMVSTGNTPTPVYQRLAAKCQAGEVSFRYIRSFTLDEYYPISREHASSFYTYIHSNFYSKVDISPENIHFLNGETSRNSLSEHMEDYENLIKSSGGIQLCLLSVGVNGHIAFNEPGSGLYTKTRKIKLTGGTISENIAGFKNPEEMPKHAISVGVSTILASKYIINVILGIKKAPIVNKIVENGVTCACPATFLQLHERSTVICDSESASQLSETNNFTFISRK